LLLSVHRPTGGWMDGQTDESTWSHSLVTS